MRLKKENQDRFLRNIVLQTANPGLLAVTSSKGETSGLDKLHNHSDHVLIWQKSQAACRYGHGARQSHMPPSDQQINKKILDIFCQ